MPAPHWLARFNRHVTNRLLGPLAMRLPGMGVIIHSGRKTGRQYRTPVLVFARDDSYVIALTYGRDSEWVKNVLAAGGCELEARGRRLQLTRPRLFHDEGRRAVPAPIRLMLGVGEVFDFLELTVERGVGEGSHAAHQIALSIDSGAVANRRTSAAVGSAVFFVLGPGVTAGLIPWVLTRWRMRQPVPHWKPLSGFGGVLLAAGLVVLVQAFARFVVEGRGTPAPAAPPDRLVVGGVYRYVRNPMYVALLAVIAGQGLLLGQLRLLVYAAGISLVAAAFVRWCEEPHLRRRFGADYDDYRRAVPAWWPRLRPWLPGERDG